jgi:N-methylhydantoinase A/oxoprolinase/acetone carboxylase beta subunit
MPLQLDRASAAVDRIARQLGVSLTGAAAGILRVSNANMERAIRLVSVERGHDPRDFALVAFGGCGGLHACEIASELGMGTVVVPAYAGALSALGMLMADAVRDYSEGALGKRDVEAAFERLERRARRESRTEPERTQIERTVDIRYRGQSYELNVPWAEGAAPSLFHREHAKIYGYSNPDREVELVTIRVRARTVLPKPTLAPPLREKGSPQSRRVWIDGSWKQVEVWKREQLSSTPRSGPALVLDYGSTTLIPPQWRFHIDRAGNLVIRVHPSHPRTSSVPARKAARR